jgi:hypothetical protein
MPAPPGYSDITAADVVGSAPFTSIPCPDDGTKPKGDDFKIIAATALANDQTKVLKTGDAMSDTLTVTGAGSHGGLVGIGGSGGFGGIGVQGEGHGTAAGGAFQGGATSGAGVIAIGGGGNAPGVDARGDGSGPAVQCTTGGVLFAGEQPAYNADPGQNMAHATNQAKAWAVITTDGSGGASISSESYNVSSVDISGVFSCVVTFARAMSSSVYAATVTNRTPHARLPSVSDTGSNASHVMILLYDSAAALINWQTTPIKVSLHVDARQ